VCSSDLRKDLGKINERIKQLLEKRHAKTIRSDDADTRIEELNRRLRNNGEGLPKVDKRIRKDGAVLKKDDINIKKKTVAINDINKRLKKLMKKKR
jgi:hypothetical protein